MKKPEKPGKHIKLQRFVDIEGKYNKCFQIDGIELFVDGVRGGYIKIAKIQKNRFGENYSKNFLEYLLFKGYRVDINNDPIQEIMKYKNFNFNEAEKFFKNELKNEIYAFMDYFIDKPYVHYISVYKSEDKYEKRFNEEYKPRESFIRNNSINFYGVGLGRILYEQAAIWLADDNMRLYAADTRWKDAQRSWENLKQDHGSAIGFEQVKTFRDEDDEDDEFDDDPRIRMYLDGSKIVPTHLDWAETMSIYNPDGSLAAKYEYQAKDTLNPQA